MTFAPIKNSSFFMPQPVHLRPMPAVQVVSGGLSGAYQTDTFERLKPETQDEKAKRLYKQGKITGDFDSFNRLVKSGNCETMIDTFIDMSVENDETPLVYLKKNNIKSVMRHSDYPTFLQLVYAEDSNGANFFQLATPQKIAPVIGYLNRNDFIWGLQKENYSGSNAFHAAAGNLEKQELFYKFLLKDEILHLATRKNFCGETPLTLYKGEEFERLTDKFNEEDLKFAVLETEENGNTCFNYLTAPELEILCSKMKKEDVEEFALKKNSKDKTPLDTQTPEGRKVLIKYINQSSD